MKQRSIVFKSQLWTIIENHDTKLRKLISKQIERLSLRYKVLSQENLGAKINKDIFIKFETRFPFGLYKLEGREEILYFSLEIGATSNFIPLKSLINIKSLSFDAQDKLPILKIPNDFLLSHPEILNKEHIYLFEKVIDDLKEYFLPFGWGTIYQLSFQLDGLRNLWAEFTPTSQAQKKFLNLREHLTEDDTKREEEKILISLEDQVDKNFPWDEAQKTAFRKISAPNPFLVLNGFAGTGKTTVMNAGWKALRDFKILVLAHDHETVNFLMKKYIAANPDVIFYRIGNNRNAKTGEMEEYHIKSDNRRHYTQVLNRLDQVIEKFKNELKDNKLNSEVIHQKIQIVEEWQDFLANREEGRALFEKIKFNSARAIFCTISGLEYYNKKGLLDCFLPFDFMFVDEGSQIDLPLLFHASQFCKANIIAGDKNLIQPLKLEGDLSSKSMNAIDELEESYSASIPEMFCTFTKEYRINIKIFTIIHEEMFTELGQRTNSPIESLVNEAELFSVINKEPYLHDDPITFIDTFNLGPKARSIKNTNPKEVDIIVKTLEQLNNVNNWENPMFKKPIKIWITSLFAKQVEILKSTIDSLREEWNNIDLYVSTVRNFSGDEADVVMWSVCNAPLSNLRNHKNIKGFSPDLLMRADLIYDLITRTKGKLIIVGVKQLLLKNAKLMQTRTQKNVKNFGKALERIINEGVTLAK